MSSITVTKGKTELYGDVVQLSNGEIELTATIGVGPRIVHLSINGQPNLMYNDSNLTTFLNYDVDGLDGDRAKLYGGHRLWISPEVVPRTYHPDNQAVDCKETGEGVILTAAVEKLNNIQKIIEIKFCGTDNKKLEVIHRIKNCGTFDITFAPWALTVMSAGGLEVIPQTKRETGFLGNRVLGLWPYTNMSDKRVYFGKDFITLKQDPAADGPFKIGLNNEEGWAAYFNHGQLFIKEYKHNPNGVYPDFGLCSFQTYTNNSMLEIETLGETTTLEPGQETVHCESWRLYKAEPVSGTDEDEIRTAVSAYFTKGN